MKTPKLIPTLKQYRSWSTPTKIGIWIGIIGIGLTIFFGLPVLWSVMPWGPKMASESGQRELSKKLDLIEKMLHMQKPISGTYEPIITQWMDISALNAWYDIGWAIVLTDGSVVKISNSTYAFSNNSLKVNWDTVRVLENTATYVKIGSPEVKYPGIETPFYTTIRIDKKNVWPDTTPPWKRPLSKETGTPVRMDLAAFGADERGILFLIGLRNPKGKKLPLPEEPSIAS